MIPGLRGIRDNKADEEIKQEQTHRGREQQARGASGKWGDGGGTETHSLAVSEQAQEVKSSTGSIADDIVTTAWGAGGCRFITQTNVQSLCGAPETDITLTVNDNRNFYKEESTK